MKHTKNMKNVGKIWKNVNLLYFIFFVSIVNIGWFLYKNKKESVLIFAASCLVIYLINQNMIFVLGISLLVVDILYLVKNKIYEGFEDDNEDDDTDTRVIDDAYHREKNIKLKEAYDEKVQNQSAKNTKKGSKNMDYTDTDDDLEEGFMHDKTIMQKLKKFDPIILDAIKNMNNSHIKDLNQSINKLINVKDP